MRLFLGEAISIIGIYNRVDPQAPSNSHLGYYTGNCHVLFELRSWPWVPCPDFRQAFYVKCPQRPVSKDGLVATHV